MMGDTAKMWGANAVREKGIEPALDDMLGDPMTQALMASDGVAAEQVLSLLAEARERSLRTSEKSSNPPRG
jgi:hypothetical protein